MAKIDDLTVDISARLTISDETAKRCLRLLEMWLDDNPGYAIVGETVRDKVQLKMVKLNDSTAGD